MKILIRGQRHVQLCVGFFLPNHCGTRKQKSFQIGHDAKAIIGRILPDFGRHLLIRHVTRGTVMNLNYPNTGLSLPYLRLLLGTISLLLSGYFSMLFLSQSTTGMDWVATLVFCVMLECSKALFAGDVLYYNAIGQQYKAGFAALMIALLFALSMLSATWFLMLHPVQDNLKLTNSTHRTAQLLQAIDDKRLQLAQCPHNHVNSCINPRNTELTAIRTKYTQALENQQSLLATQANQTFWQQCANVLGTTHNTLQLVVALVRAALLELILIAQFFSSRRLQATKAMQNEYCNARDAFHDASTASMMKQNVTDESGLASNASASTTKQNVEVGSGFASSSASGTNASASRTKQNVTDESDLASTASTSRTEQNVTDGSDLASTASASRTKQNVEDGSSLASVQRTIACKRCSTVITQKRSNHFFCSDKCRKAAHNTKK
jgi:hypothetical protein